MPGRFLTPKWSALNTRMHSIPSWFYIYAILVTTEERSWIQEGSWEDIGRAGVEIKRAGTDKIQCIYGYHSQNIKTRKERQEPK